MGIMQFTLVVIWVSPRDWRPEIVEKFFPLTSLGFSLGWMGPQCGVRQPKVEKSHYDSQSVKENTSVTKLAPVVYYLLFIIP